MKGCRVLMLLAIASFVWAMPNIYGTMGLIKSISADNGKAGTFNFGFYGRGYQITRDADPTGDSIGNALAGNESKYGAGDIGLYFGYSFTDWFSFNVAGVYMGEGIDYQTSDENRASIGFGDTKVGMKFGLGGEHLKYGLYTFFSIPTGTDRSVDDLELKDYPFFNICYANKGGLFRYFSSDGFDFGAVGLFSTRAGGVNLDLNLGYVLTGAKGGGLRDNYSIFNAALSYDGDWAVPFVELSGIDYPNDDEILTLSGDDRWGKNPVYITPGISFQPGHIAFTMAVDFRAWEGENDHAFPTAQTDSFNVTTGFGATPNWVAHFGFSYTHDFTPEIKRGMIAGLVIDAKTKNPLEANVGIYREGTMIESKVSAIDGTFEFKALEPDIHKLMVNVTDYKPFEVDLLVKPGESTPVTVELEAVVKEGMLVLNIMDMESRQPMPANVVIGDMAAEKTEGRWEKKLLAGTYKVKVMAEAENYIDYEREVMIEAGKTLEIEVALVKKEFKIVLPQVYFETGKSEIKPESYPVLDDACKTISKVLETNPDIKIEIQGHTDSVGSDSYNLRLSQDRAASVMNYIVTKHGISSARLIARGYGESQPIASNKTLDGRSKNRRVEFVILK